LSARIFLITGLMASGKSTVAQALARRFPRSVHLRGDSFRRMIVNGQEPMSFELSEAARRQLALRYDLSVQTAKGYADAGYTVIYQDIILGPPLAEVAAKFDGYPLSVVVLCPGEETISRRESDRGKSGYKNRAEIAAFARVLHEETAHIGTWVDSSGLTVAETVNQILAATDGDQA
jgi:predicted kinase